MADETDTVAVYILAGLEPCHARSHIAGAAVQSGLQPVAGGAADAPVVETENGDSLGGDEVGQNIEYSETVEVGVPVLSTATADEHDGGKGSSGVGERQIAGEGDEAVGEGNLLPAVCGFGFLAGGRLRLLLLGTLQ